MFFLFYLKGSTCTFKTYNDFQLFFSPRVFQNGKSLCSMKRSFSSSPFLLEPLLIFHLQAHFMLSSKILSRYQEAAHRKLLSLKPDLKKKKNLDRSVIFPKHRSKASTGRYGLHLPWCYGFCSWKPVFLIFVFPTFAGNESYCSLINRDQHNPHLFIPRIYYVPSVAKRWSRSWEFSIE